LHGMVNCAMLTDGSSLNEFYSDFATVGQIPRSAGCYPSSIMEAKGLTPILNVSDIAGTVAWFEKWGWKKLWDWGTPPTFGAVGSGKEACIFLCQGAQGGRGRGGNTTTFQEDGDEAGDKGVWMSVWVDDVDEMHKHCVAAGLEVTFPPTDMPWNVREMHLRHPDGHVFRVGRGFEPKK
jgi:glyoxalase/bleomycin resistance protein/dioxygenase superfamily protein